MKLFFTSSIILILGNTFTQEFPISVARDSNFLMPTENILNQMFPTNKPNLLLFTKDKKVSIAFEYGKTNLKSTDILLLLKLYKEELQESLNINKIDTNINYFQDLEWAEFIFKNNKGYRIEQKITSIKDKSLIITIQSTEKDYENNKESLNKLLNSIKVD